MAPTRIGHRVAALPLCRFAASCLPEPLGEFVYAVTTAEGIILSLFMSNEQ